MPITVTILKPNVFDEYGRLLAIGSAYVPYNDDYAKTLVQTLKALDTNNVLGFPLPTIAGAAMTWIARPSAAAFPGTQIRFTDVGGNTGAGGGNFFFSNGTRWKPVNEDVLLDSVDTANSAVANTTEQQLNPNHIAIPAGVIGIFDRIRLYVSLSKNGTVDSATINIRFGPLGTVADPILATITSLATTNQSEGFILEFKRTAATAMQKQGNASTDLSYTGASAGAYPAAVTISNPDTNIMYLSITSQMTTGAEVCTLQNYTLELFSTDSQ